MTPSISRRAARLSVISIFILSTIFPVFASAQSVVDYQAQINALLQQLSELQSALSQIKTSPPVMLPESDDYPTNPRPDNSCPNLSVTLQYGSRDARTDGQVTELQMFL